MTIPTRSALIKRAATLRLITAPRAVCAFTLIELLVVVGIIALLISILLPSLSHAREQARIAKCLSNLRSIAQSGTAYLYEFDDLPWALPWGYTVGKKTYTNRVISEYIWGGGMPTATDEIWEENGRPGERPPSETDVYHIPPNQRPMNPYIDATVSWNAPPTDPPAQPREDQPVTPGVFQCPSDHNPHVPFVGALNLVPEDGDFPPCWEFWGNSYPINWYWPYYYMAAPPGGTENYDEFHEVIGAVPDRQSLGKVMFRRKVGGFASEFIMFYENQLNFALEAAKPPGYTGGPWASASKNLRGWHGKRDHHVAAFLDGSARYQVFNTRYISGPNWTIWPTRPWYGEWEPYSDIVPEVE